MQWRSALTFALAMGLIGPASAMGQDTRPGIAVWPFENGGSYGQDAEDFEALRVGLQQILITELARNGSMRVVERARLNELIQEQDLGASGRVDPNTAAQVGKLVGAKFMVLGGFVDLFGDFRIDARIVDVETGELTKLTANRAPEGGLAWAPDGSSILFTAADDQECMNRNTKLWLLDP